MPNPPDEVLTPAVESKNDATLQLPPAGADIALPATLGRRYRLTAKVGGGGMAVVYQAHDTHLDREVAVKVIAAKLRQEPDFDARFRREAQILSRLRDPHVVVVHDFGLDEMYGPFLVMELLGGESLRQRLHKVGPLPVPAALQLGEQLMLALAHAHAAGVIHRDLKPDNVVLTAQSGVRLHVRVLDFGISRLLYGDRAAPGHLTEPGAIVGTPRYMAPEQQSGQPADERSDLYSAALVIYEAITGELPDVSGLKLRTICPAAPEELQPLLEQCLRGNPDDRPIHATEAYLHLHELARANTGALCSESAVNQLTMRFRAPTPPPAAPALRTHRRAWMGTTLGAGLGLAVALWWSQSTVGDRALAIAGVRVGDHRDDVARRFPTLPPGDRDHVWVPAGHPLAALIHTDDLRLSADDSGRAELLAWPNGDLAILFVDSTVRAVAARLPRKAPVGFGVSLGDDEMRWRKRFPTPPDASPEVMPATVDEPGWGLLYRYTKDGVAVATRGGVVTAAAAWQVVR